MWGFRVIVFGVWGFRLWLGVMVGVPSFESLGIWSLGFRAQGLVRGRGFRA